MRPEPEAPSGLSCWRASATPLNRASVDRPSPYIPQNGGSPSAAKQRSKRQVTIRLSPEMLAYFKNLHVQHSDWAAANSQPGFASLGDFLGDVLDGYPALCAAYDEALESIKRQGADLVFLAAALKAAGGEEYQVVSIDEARLRMAAPKGGGLN